MYTNDRGIEVASHPEARVSEGLALSPARLVSLVEVSWCGWPRYADELADAWALKAACDRVDGPAPESPERSPRQDDGVLRAEPSAIDDSLLAASNDRALPGNSADEPLRLVSPSSSL